MIRPPAVAGQFYPAGGEELAREVGSYMLADSERREAFALVSPHAGYVYSGHVAGAAFSSVVVPNRFVVLCPNHTGIGAAAAIISEGAWSIPGAEIPIDSELAAAIASRTAVLAEDHLAHQREHSLEVQLPFIDWAAKDPAFVPICLRTQRYSDLEEIGKAMAEAIREIGEDVLIVASSDMSHFLSDEKAREVDRKAIDKILEIDPQGLLNTVLGERISMCGVAPVTAALVAALELGATKAELIKYATSADIFGDRSRVVGYAGIRIS
ncbi:MAG TPA: AmmeMemoRadiSam system protein B [Acidobacteriota bacterium]|nr:AmmeMemoRadiSam system protein B [Acidobacteriota bacterium]